MKNNTMNTLIGAAQDESPVDLLVRNVRLVNVLSGEIHDAHIAVKDGIVVGFEEYEALHVVEGNGRHCIPGLIDGHIHIESTLLSPARFAAAAAPHGTAAVMCDPHEIANVMGAEGIEYMLHASAGLPLSVYVMMPSCVPATHMETAGATLRAEDVQDFLSRYPDRMPGLAEMMNYPGVLFRDDEVMAKLEAAASHVIDGHAPLLRGKALNAYVLGGPASDHETSDADEAREKLRKGMHLMIREGGSQEHNLEELVTVLNEFNTQNVSFVSDDKVVNDLMESGHMDDILRKAMAAGIPPVRAVQMASINTARYFRLHRRGAVAPGYRADFVLLDDLQTMRISECYLGGRNVKEIDFTGHSAAFSANTVHVAGLNTDSLHVAAGNGNLRVIGIVPGQVITHALELPPTLREGAAVADPSRDLAKLAVFERHKGTGNVGLGFTAGLGLHKGALAGTVSHDSHNLIVAGMDDADMITAAEEVQRIGGGLAVACDGRVLASLPLPIAGLMSDAPVEDVLAGLRGVNEALATLGYKLSSPFAALAFLSLAVIPSLKLTDKGLVDVHKFEIVPLWTA
ncbi:adenine deaminase [Oleidesulfovibrio alaskensis]|jgi:adenine deaminase|uniref:adenine deaminase n=1 Tax=Oleidesulfovibrio alaskensis TaxID=58180 RepID=UPI00040E46A2|nr:adenine deaminase [Oleidesulfovibrio alaskensis]MBL3583637.1 adenine deaminase [Oleidesulfovibrio alaskensis]